MGLHLPEIILDQFRFTGILLRYGRFFDKAKTGPFKPTLSCDLSDRQICHTSASVLLDHAFNWPVETLTPDKSGVLNTEQILHALQQRKRVENEFIDSWSNRIRMRLRKPT